MAEQWRKFCSTGQIRTGGGNSISHAVSTINEKCHSRRPSTSEQAKSFEGTQKLKQKKKHAVLLFHIFFQWGFYWSSSIRRPDAYLCRPDFEPSCGRTSPPRRRRRRQAPTPCCSTRWAPMSTAHAGPAVVGADEGSRWAENSADSRLSPPDRSPDRPGTIST